jgi:predicted membrane channel-forming protein YqfA (hemolysin III family)
MFEEKQNSQQWEEKRFSIWSRLLAFSFICLILLANFSFSYYITGRDIPVWTTRTSEFFMLASLCLGAVVLIQYFLNRKRL